MLSLRIVSPAAARAALRPTSFSVVGRAAARQRNLWLHPTIGFKTINPHTLQLRAYTMSGHYEVLCLENPLLDIQGVG